MKEFRIFLSSPGDVGKEREIAARVLERLKTELLPRGVELRPYFWEYQPMRATKDFQEQIPLTSEFDLVVCILWSRLGSRLHVKHRRPDGRLWNSGTEYEFETAAEAARSRGTPDLLVYINKTPPQLILRAGQKIEEQEAQLKQFQALNDFIDRWCKEATDQTFKAAFNQYADLARFEELLENHLRTLLEEKFPAIDPNTGAPADSGSGGARPAPTWTGQSPFRGLAAFHFDHAPIFFGRTRAIDEVLDRLRAQAAAGSAFVLVLGMSGGGKSSLVRAGVLPLLMKPGVIEGIGLWRRVVLQPREASGDLFDGLAAALVRSGSSGQGLPELTSDGTTPEAIARELRENPASAATLIRGGLSQAAALLRREEETQIRAWLTESQREGRQADTERYEKMLADLPQREARLVLVIDQLEEIWTMPSVTPEMRVAYVAALAALARGGRVWVLGTLRSDFYPRCAELPELVALKSGAGQYDVLPPEPAEVGQMIRQPALAAGLRFERDRHTEQDLDETLRDAAKGDAGTLPLLQFALAALYEKRTPAGVLTYAAYESIGGIEGALAQRAEEVYSALAPEQQAALIRVMRGLVTLGLDEGEGIFNRRWADKAEITDTPGSRELVDAFVEARLFIADKADDGRALVSVTHEALLTRWPRLRALLLEDKEFLRARAHVAAAAERWLEENRSPDFLLSEGKPLLEAETLLTRSGDDLTADEADYVKRSLVAARSRARAKLHRLQAAAAVFLVLALASTVGAYFGFKGRAGARAAQAVSEQEKARAQSALAQVSQTLARSDLLQSVKLLEQNRVDSALAHLARALRTEPGNPSALDLASSLLLQRDWPLPQTEPIQHGAKVNTIAFSPDGRTILTSCSDGTARLYDATTGEARFGGEPLRQKAVLVSARYSADGRKIVTASWDTTAQVWNAETGKAIGAPLKHGSIVSAAAISPDGRRVVTGSWDKTARLWDAETSAPLGEPLVHPEMVTIVAFSPDGRQVLTVSGNEGAPTNPAAARVFDAETGQPIGEPMRHAGLIHGALFSPDGKKIVTVSADSTARLWDAATGKGIGEPMPHPGTVTLAAFRPDGARLATGGTDGGVRFWDAATGKPIPDVPILRHDDRIYALVFSADGRRLLSGSQDRTTRVWDATTGQPLTEPMRHRGGIAAAAFSPDGARVATASSDGSIDDGVAQVWNVRSGRARPLLFVHREDILGASLTPDGRQLLTTSVDRIARTWDAGTGKLLTARTPQPDGKLLGFSPDGKLLLTAGPDHTVRLWDAATGQPVGAPMRHPAEPRNGDFTKDGRRLVLGCANGVSQVWEVATGKAIGAPLVHKENIASARFSPDGRKVVTASFDNTARVWDAETGQPLTEPLVHKFYVSRALFSPDGQRVATSSYDRSARVWDATTGKPVTGPLAHENIVLGIIFSSDGQRVATAAGDNSARIWDAATGQPVTEPLRHGKVVFTAVFSPDNRRLLTASLDKTIRLWDSSTGQPLSDPISQDAPVIGAGFEPPDNGRQALAAGSDGTVRLWDLFAAGAGTGTGATTTGPAPAWYAELLEALGGARFNARGILEPVTGTLPALRRQHAGGTGGGDDFTRIARWFFADRATRTVSPFSPVPMTDYIAQCLESSTLGPLNDAARLDPANPVVLAAQADLRIDSALADFYCRHALTTAPENAEVRFRVGISRKDDNLPLLALAEFEKATSLDPKQAKYFKAKADVLWTLERPVLALQAANEAVHLEPENMEARRARGYIHAQRGEQAAAIADLEAALRPAPADKITQRIYGWTLLLFGDNEGALTHFEAAGDFGFTGRAACFWLKGDKPLAITTYRELIKVNASYLKEATVAGMGLPPRLTAVVEAVRAATLAAHPEIAVAGGR